MGWDHLGKNQGGEFRWSELIPGGEGYRGGKIGK
jgi:hypothetical protein